MNYSYFSNKRSINKIKKLYEDYQIFDCFSDKRFLAKINNTTIKIFSNNKVSIINDDNEFERIAFIEMKYNKRNIVIEKNQYFEKKKQLTNKKIKETYKYNKVATIGVDEVGVSEYMHPLVIASVLVPEDKIEFLKLLGVKDSKKLSKPEIMKIGFQLTNNLIYNTQVLANENYNKLYNCNYTKLKVDMCNKAIKSILNSSVEYIILDSFTNEKNYYDNSSTKDLIRNITFIAKADEHVLSVSAASIIAKYTLYLELNKIENKYKIIIPSNQKEMLKLTKRLVKLHGENIIDKLCKKNYIFTQKILQEIEDEQL